MSNDRVCSRRSVLRAGLGAASAAGTAWTAAGRYPPDSHLCSPPIRPTAAG